MKRVVAGLVVLVAVVTLIVVTRDSSRQSVPDAFSPDSFWNTPIPADAAVDPRSDQIMAFLSADNRLDGCITLAGASKDEWGMPIYLSDGTSPEFAVESTKYNVPGEFQSLRIPKNALPAATSDAEMVIYDVERGYVAQLSKAAFASETNTWTVTGGSIAYLDSNGIYGAIDGIGDPRNGGSFRGYNGAIAAVSYDDVLTGRVDNVLKIGVNSSRDEAVFPLINSDGDSLDPDAPSQGQRLRIRADADLTQYGLNDQALIIARGLQEFGAIIGDSTGGGVVLKLEDMKRAGTDGSWSLDRTSLCSIPASDYQIVATDLP